MLLRFYSFYKRFKSQHFELIARGFPIRSKSGQLIGNIDQVKLTDHQINLIGWCQADQISLITNGGGTAEAVPSELRQDVSDAFGGTGQVGFRLTQAKGNGRYTLVLKRAENDVPPIHFKPISKFRIWLCLACLAFRFYRTLLKSLPEITKWILRKDHASRLDVKKAMGFADVGKDQRLDGALLLGNDDLKRPSRIPKEITIILPIYNAFDLLPEVLERVTKHTSVPAQLILIEDCSSDPHLRPWVRTWVKSHQTRPNTHITLIENAENLGFIGSVNLGFKRALEHKNHVVLLNSDAFLPEGWAERLLEPMLRDPTTATTTPMSNDAEIFSVPEICQGIDLMQGQGDEIDRVAAKLPIPPSDIETPTGVGFCMAINSVFLEKLPQFDTTFGKGYGEEVDWCQKIRCLKGRHVAVPNLFVEHRGSASFGEAAKQAVITDHNAIVSRRHPNYDLEIQRFIKSDPLRTQRMALAVAWATSCAQGHKVPIYLAHSLGGGAELYLKKRVNKDWAERALPSVILRVGGDARWRVEVIGGQRNCCGGLDDIQDVLRLLRPIQRRHLIYSCGVGAPNPIALPGELLALKTNSECSVDILVHDYFMVSPNYTLLNEIGVYIAQGQAFYEQENAKISSVNWQTAWRPLIAKADNVIVFSQSSRDIFLAAYPFARRKIKVQPHDLLVTIPKLHRPYPSAGKRVVAVLGNIGFHKGAAVLGELAGIFDGDRDISIMVLGEVDPHFSLPRSVHVHGAYNLDALPDLVRRYEITDWFIPSIWPETFSYTTHEALATGLPTFAFALGAQGDAVASRENGKAIKYGHGHELARNAYRTITEVELNRQEPSLKHAAGL